MFMMGATRVTAAKERRHQISLWRRMQLGWAPLLDAKQPRSDAYRDFWSIC